MHGYSLPFPSNVEEILFAHDSNKHSGLKVSKLSSVVKLLRKDPLSFPFNVIRAFGKLSLTVPRKVLSSGRQLICGKNRRHKSWTLTEKEFLALRIDLPDALNWQWREPHWLAVFKPGETFAEARDRLKDTRLPEGVAPDTSVEFDEPMAFSRKFWKSGNNSLLAPLHYGYRHLVVPYEATNLYINRKIQPPLFSATYYQSLPLMTEEEIADFLSDNPIEITDGAVTSGRHRATAMLGRLLRGEPYVPMVGFAGW